MDVHAALDAPVGANALFAWVDDLDRYPDWLDIVPRVQPAEPADGDPGPAWLVDLRGRLGPLARSKRLRMVRTEIAPPTQVKFERREHDGREHSPWILEANIESTEGDRGSRLTMHLHYGGGLWGPLLEPLLRDAIERSRPRLLACLTA